MDDRASFDYERSDIETGGIALVAAGLGLFVIAVPLLMPLVYPQSMQHVSPAAPPGLSANAPQLEIAPTEDLRRINRAEAQLAEGYSWADREHGAVKIPITRAIKLLLQKGLPGWPSR
jgi:hypothetical protein